MNGSPTRTPLPGQGVETELDGGVVNVEDTAPIDVVDRTPVHRPMPQTRPAEEEAAPNRAPAAPAPELSLWAAFKQRIAHGKPEQAEGETEPSVPVLWIVGSLAVSSTVAAFILSFTMLLLVVRATGWSGQVAHLGPVVPDVAALAAAVMLVARVKRGLAWLLLIGSTGMSIAGNLAGHAIVRAQEAAAGAPVLPGSWGWVGNAFSVFVPVVMAVLVHISMDQIADYLDFRARKHAQAEEARAEEARRRERAEELRRQAEKARESLPRPPKRGAVIEKPDGVTIGIALHATTPKEIRAAVVDLGWVVECSDGTLKNWARTVREALGVDPAGSR